MSLSFYLTFVAYVFTFGINGPGPVNSQLPQNFLLSNGNSCPYLPKITCPTKPLFRPIDGSCNNLKFPYSGKSQTPYMRMIFAMYKDSKYPRNTTFQGAPLPSTREISVKLFKSESKPDDQLSLIATTFARFVEHDLYKTKLLDASKCCTLIQDSGACDNIKVSRGDPIFSKYFKTCLPKGKFVNSPTLDCNKDTPQQINEHTHTLDLSNIYGSTKNISDRLRTHKDGLLKTSETKNLLPVYALQECIISYPDLNKEHCFDAGDLRANVDPLIMTMYTIWVRHHNNIATKLKSVLKDGSDENLFQTARKIVIAQYQHIVYNELLEALDSKSKLKTPPSDTTVYRDTVKPAIFNAFSLVYTAIVDSMVAPKITVGTKNLELKDIYYTPAELFETDGVKNMLEAMQKEKAELIDSNVVKALTNYYLRRGLLPGTDKVALNLQQSRENGVPVYAIYNRLLNIIAAIPDNKLTAVYPNKQDIELLPGLLYEKPADGAKYGETIKVIMDKQFKELRAGDPFFYSHEGVLNPVQLADVKIVTLGKILCDNGGLTEVLRHALKLIAPQKNEVKQCSQFIKMNVCAWSINTWSGWIDNGCKFDVRVYTRECNNLPGSTCKCNGDAIKFEECQGGSFQNVISIETIKKINETFYENFGSDGKPLNPNKSNFAVMLKNLTR